MTRFKSDVASLRNVTTIRSGPIEILPFASVGRMGESVELLDIRLLHSGGLGMRGTFEHVRLSSIYVERSASLSIGLIASSVLPVSIQNITLVESPILIFGGPVIELQDLVLSGDSGMHIKTAGHVHISNVLLQNVTAPFLRIASRQNDWNSVSLVRAVGSTVLVANATAGETRLSQRSKKRQAIFLSSKIRYYISFCVVNLFS